MDEKTLYCASGGCSAKLGIGALRKILSALPPQDEQALLVGFDHSDDAAVYALTDDIAVVQTLDFFPPMVEDPFLFGQIAAANALSDIYAMGAQVKSALNIVCFPEKEDFNLLGEILRGGLLKVKEAGGVLCGGHSIADSGVKYGLSVMGTVHPDKIWRNQGAQVGDRLILTKPLGTGLVLCAKTAQEATSAQIDAAIASMTTLNRAARDGLLSFDVHACTDVTGFGLLGHLSEMTGGRVGARIDSSNLPALPGALAAASAFLLTGAAQKNRNFLAPRVHFDGVPFEYEELLFDAQTSGGLLVALPPSQSDLALNALGVNAACIGEIIPLDTYELEVSQR